MSEAETIACTPSLRTRESLAGDLRALGLKAGSTVLVHASLSSLGWVCGGPVAVIQALMDVLGDSGTLVMPSFSGDYSDPSPWQDPAVPKEWWTAIRDSMPAFEPLVTPSRNMGSIAETFRTWPRVLRSSHPVVSFAAWGCQAEFITNRHTLEYSLGEGSPLARLYEGDGMILLLGVGWERCTSFHLSEVRAGVAKVWETGSPVMADGGRAWTTYVDLDYDASPFGAIGRAFEEESGMRTGSVGSAEARLLSLRRAVDFAARWMALRGHRAPLMASCV